MKHITQKTIEMYRAFLISEEKSVATVQKYIHDVQVFLNWLATRELMKMQILSYKSKLLEQYAPASVNAVLSSLNSFFRYMGRDDLRVKNVKIQRQTFSSSDRELSKIEYKRLLAAAQGKKNDRLFWLLQTVCSTGIRVSELRFITVDSLRRGVAEIACKGKCRKVFLPRQLCSGLWQYIQRRGIHEGSIFVTRTGRPLDRSNIWSEMKKLCKVAGVLSLKVFPHNLRHLFARTYYSEQRDVVRLADILGHSSVNTTRIYTVESGEIHCRQIQKLGLLL